MDPRVILPIEVGLTSVEWFSVTDYLTKPWPEKAVIIDLRAYRLVTRKVFGEDRRPGVRVLANRWGWSKTRAADFIRQHWAQP